MIRLLELPYPLGSEYFGLDSIFTISFPTVQTLIRNYFNLIRELPPSLMTSHFCFTEGPAIHVVVKFDGTAVITEISPDTSIFYAQSVNLPGKGQILTGANIQRLTLDGGSDRFIMVIFMPNSESPKEKIYGFLLYHPGPPSLS